MSKIITESQLAELIAGLDVAKRAGFVSITTATEPKMLVKNRETKERNPYLGRVKRMAIRLGMLGVDYSNAVNNQREREGCDNAGEFQAESLWNGKGRHVSRSLVRHADTSKLYCVFYPSKTTEDHAKVSADMWTCDGVEIDKAVLVPYLPPVSTSGRQETESPVLWRTVALENIVAITMEGESYTINHG